MTISYKSKIVDNNSSENKIETKVFEKGNV